MRNSEKILVAVDFDGTITQQDVGALLFDTFSHKMSRKIVSLWLKGEINSKECLEKECELLEVTKSELKKFARAQKIDEHFSSFVDLCKREKLRLVILSDGLDFYIRLILKESGLDGIPFRSNVLRFEKERPKPEFPHYHRGCGNCGNCKRYHLLSLKRAGQKIVYIGDGLSDKCAVREADLVFAKNDLRKFCVKEHIRHFPFRDFEEVIRIFREALLEHRNLFPFGGDGRVKRRPRLGRKR
ncbi:MAG: MtnX-like HAD-IB family phosphatase [Candidatus Zixiibacteriota bacterium]